MKEKITENTSLAKILNLPETERTLAKYNLPCPPKFSKAKLGRACLDCPFAKLEMENLKIG